MSDIKENSYDENFTNVLLVSKKKLKKCCSVDTIKSFVYILNWLPKYKAKFIVPDFVAGLTVGLTTIPQAIAYGTVAGLTPQYGLYSAFMGCFVYIIFGTCKDITVGPTAIMALMVQTHVSASADYAILSCFLSGCVILLMGLLNLGVLVRFISVPVTTGFTMAAAITIASGQINNLFGIQSPSNEFIESWSHFITHINEARRNDTILGILTLIFLLLMRKLKDIPSSYKTLIKYISLSRNAAAVIIGIILCYFFSHNGWLPFRISGEITPGIPPFELPPFSTTVNGTYFGFSEMLSNLGASLASIPLISILESIAVAKAFSKGKIIDASQEMIALGFCNVLSSFVSSMPITGSFTRTAINNSSGVKTQLGGAVTGILVLMALAFLTTTFYFIPKATLAAIIIAAMIFMIEYETIAEIWRSKKIDIFPFLVTVISCLFWSLEYGMVCGVLTNMIFILYSSAMPRIVLRTEKINNHEWVIVIPDSLNYSSAEYLKSKVVKYVSPKSNDVKAVVINGIDIHSIDSTVALNIISLRDDLHLLNCKLICWNWMNTAVGVICRLQPKTRDMFSYSKSLGELVTSEMLLNTQAERDTTLVHM